MGHIVGAKGIRVDPEKISAVTDWPDVWQGWLRRKHSADTKSLQTGVQTKLLSLGSVLIALSYSL